MVVEGETVDREGVENPFENNFFSWIYFSSITLHSLGSVLVRPFSESSQKDPGSQCGENGEFW